MKTHTLLIFLLCTVVSMRISAIGLGGYLGAGYISPDQNREPGNSLTLGAGIEVGFLTPYLLDAIVSIGMGSLNDRTAFLTSYILHYTHMVANQVGIYVGAGLGIDAIFGSRFSEKRDPTEADLHGVLVSGIFPVGVKFFTKVSLEIYAEARFHIGRYYTWAKYYTTAIPDPSMIGNKVSSESFYWGVGGRMGLRYWY
ncbi:MAG: hypothetical protein ACRCVN_05455 [Spirochaetia bacterium]